MCLIVRIRHVAGLHRVVVENLSTCYRGNKEAPVIGSKVERDDDITDTFCSELSTQHALHFVVGSGRRQRRRHDDDRVVTGKDSLKPDLQSRIEKRCFSSKVYDIKLARQHTQVLASRLQYSTTHASYLLAKHIH